MATNGAASAAKFPSPGLVTGVGDQMPATFAKLVELPWVKHRMQALIPEHMNAERMLRIAAMAAYYNPTLGKVAPMSILGALFKLGHLGLEPNTPLQHAFLVPFKGRQKDGDRWVDVYNVEVIIGYRGYMHLARNGGMVGAVNGEVIYSADEFDYQQGSKPFLHHKQRLVELGADGAPQPALSRGVPIGAYAVAQLQGCEAQFVVLNMPRIYQARAHSSGYQTALAAFNEAAALAGGPDKIKKLPKGWLKCPWVAHPDPMAAKTAIRAISNLLPLSPKMMAAVQLDQAKLRWAELAESPTDRIIEAAPSDYSEEDDDGGDDDGGGNDDAGGQADEQAGPDASAGQNAPAAAKPAAAQAQARPAPDEVKATPPNLATRSPRRTAERAAAAPRGNGSTYASPSPPADFWGRGD